MALKKADAPKFLSRRRVASLAEQVRRERISIALKARYAARRGLQDDAEPGSAVDLSTGFDPRTKD